MKEFIITEKEKGLKLDKFLKMKVDANQTFLLIMSRKKQIKINGVVEKDLKYILNRDDIVSIYIRDEYFKDVRKVKAPFDIIYEDENILVVDKDIKMPVHYTKGNNNNLLSLATHYLTEKGELNPSLKFTPQVSMRIDTNTKGLVIISKNIETLTILNKLVNERKIDKYYYAVVSGKFNQKEGLLKDYLLIDEKKNTVKVIKEKVDNSKEIITAYKVLKENDDLSLVEVKLITGRLHQIRAHLSYYNHPVLGDNKYGDIKLNQKYNLKTQELIAKKIVFNSPICEHLKYLENKKFISLKHTILD